MKPLTDISKIKQFYGKHSQATVKTFIIIAQCVLLLRTVCLYKCKDKGGEVSGKREIKASSHYKRLLRFFDTKNVIAFCEGTFMFILSMLGVESSMIVLDRTNWKIENKNVNLLTLGVLFNHCFIPLCWQQMNKRGNSNFNDRQALVNRFLRWWQRAGKQIKDSIMIADREFIGMEWFEYLREVTIHFVFRLRENMYFELQQGCKKNDS